MIQAVNGLPLTMEDQIQCQTSPCAIFCGQSALRQVFPQILWLSPVSIISVLHFNKGHDR